MTETQTVSSRGVSGSRFSNAPDSADRKSMEETGAGSGAHDPPGASTTRATFPTITPERSPIRCPTCRAKQEWSETCRRCGSNLSLLRRFEARARWYREHCLLALNAKDYQTAAAYARAHFDITPDAEATRLLAVCLIQTGDFAGARALAESLDQKE